MMASFTFDGHPITFEPDQTVGAALFSAGLTSLRTTRRRGKPRGMFCGIGVCFDCLVVVDGTPSQRACLVPAASGLDVRTQVGSGFDELST